MNIDWYEHSKTGGNSCETSCNYSDICRFCLVIRHQMALSRGVALAGSSSLDKNNMKKGLKITGLTCVIAAATSASVPLNTIINHPVWAGSLPHIAGRFQNSVKYTQEMFTFLSAMISLYSMRRTLWTVTDDSSSSQPSQRPVNEWTHRRLSSNRLILLPQISEVFIFFCLNIFLCTLWLSVALHSF